MFRRSYNVSARRPARRSILAVGVTLTVVTALAPCVGGSAWAEEPQAAGHSTRELADQLLAKSNAERAAAGLGILRTNLVARSISKGHSDAMAAAKDIWHNKAYFARGRKALGAKFLGENVAVAGTIDRAHLALMRSPGHRANILRPIFNYVGYTVSIDDAGLLYATQNFAFIPVYATPNSAFIPEALVASVAPVAQAVVVLSGTTASGRLYAIDPAPFAPAEQGSNRMLFVTISGLLLLSVAAGLKRFAMLRLPRPS